MVGPIFLLHCNKKNMYKIFPLCFVAFFMHLQSVAQTYTLWSIGSPNDTVTSPAPCTLLMGGATEDDQAMTKFLQYADHGDIVVIRTSGSDGYNIYLYSDLGVQVNSVQTLLIPTVAAANDSFVVQTVRNAEALWIAGGDQWTYVSNWKNTPLNTAINYLINVRHVPVGGTSAGMAIMSEYYNSAQGGSAQSPTVLANPYDPTVTIGSSDFLHNPLLEDIITDTHFDYYNRNGRLMTFMARTWKDSNVKINAIACDEYTSVFIDTNYKATVYGGKPSADDNAYFLRVDCAGNNAIQNCVSGTPLNWKQDSTVVKVYKIQSDSSGTQYFDLRNFGATPTYTNNGGIWQDWWVDNGTFNSKTGSALLCNSVSSIYDNTSWAFNIQASPNPFSSAIQLNINLTKAEQLYFTLTDMTGKAVFDSNQYTQYPSGISHQNIEVSTDLVPGLYFLIVKGKSGIQFTQKLIKE